MDKNNLTQQLQLEEQRDIFSLGDGSLQNDAEGLNTEEARGTIAEYAKLGQFDSARVLFLTTITALNDWSSDSPRWLQEVTKLVLVYCEMEQKAVNKDSVQQAAYRLLDLCRNPVKEIDESAIAFIIADSMEKIAAILTKNRQYLVATALLNRILSMRIAISKKSDTVANMNKTASVMEKMAISTHMQGHLAEAEKLFRTTLAVREASCERDNSVIQKWYKAGTMELIGDLYSVMNQQKKAYYYFGQCVNILDEARQQAARPERVMRHITSISNKLGDVALNTNELAQARKFYEESLQGRRLALEKNIKKGNINTENSSRDIVFSLLRLADLDFREGNLEESEIKLKEAVSLLDVAIETNGEKNKLLESYYVPFDRLIRLQAQKGDAEAHAHYIDKMSKLLRKLVSIAPDNLNYRKWFEEF